jgi:hypothetical protein
MKFFSRIRPTASLLVMLAAVLLLAQTALYGQATGSVTGIVADSAGAVIPKAVIVLTNLETGVAHTTTSNSLGNWAFAGITPGGSYQFEVKSANFDPWQSQPFPVRAGDALSFTDIRLKVGATTASVTVESAIDSEQAALDSGERSDIITAKDLETLTVVGRDAGELVRMLPGYAMGSGNQGLFNRPGYDTAVVGLSGPSGSFSANGSGPTGIATVIDGVSLTDIETNSGSVQQMNMDMIQDIKASSSSYGAATAKGPAVISASSKTGGSSFHGAAYMIARDASMNSNDWYDNFLQQSRPAGRYLFPGGNLGGPLLLPFTTYNKNRDKLFFFVGYEYYNQQFEANQQALTAWVPTLAERQGDFSAASLDAQLCGARPDGLANPNAIQSMCNTNNYLENGAVMQNQNAAPYANAGGVALINWFPTPNADPFTNPSGYNYIQQIMQTQNGSQFKATLQYVLDPNNSLFFVYGLQKQVAQDPVSWGSFPSASVPYTGNVTTGDISNILSGRYSRTLGTVATNELSVAMSLVSQPGKMSNPQAVDRFDMNSFNGGKGNFNYLGMFKNGGDYSVPAITSGGSSGYPNLQMPGGFYSNNVRVKKTDPMVQDNLSWQLRNHFLQFGVYYETGTYDGQGISNSYPQGELSFNVGTYLEYTSPAFKNTNYVACQNPNPAAQQRNSGAAYQGSCFNPSAMMYMGLASQFTQSNFVPEVDMQYTTMAGFVNDQVKLKHNITVVAGFRLEHLGPWTDKHNNGLATFSDSLYNSQCGGYLRSCTSPGMPGVTWASQKTGVSNSVNSPQAVYFTPRVGAAWDIGGKGRTIVRGGWGVYRNQEQFAPYALAASTAQGFRTSQLNGDLNFGLIDNQTPNNPPDVNAYVLSPTDTSRPVYYEFNGGIDREITWKWLKSHASVAYVGSHSVNLGSYNQGSSYNSASDLNIICGIETDCATNNNPNNPKNNLFFVDETSITGVPGVDTPGIYSMTSGITTAQMDFFRPYPFFAHIYQLKHNFYNNYSSMQAQWNKTSGIVTYGANYTFAKNLATAASWNNNIVDPRNLRNDYNPVAYDRTHVVNVHYMINPGRLYKGHERILNQVANNWQLTGISQWMSGTPLASQQGENFGFGYGSLNAVQVQYPNQSNPQSYSQCANTYHITNPDYCVTGLDPVVWLGTSDIQLMPTLPGNPKAGLKTHQFMNPTAFGIPLPETNGVYRLPYLHGPSYMDHDMTLLKNFTMGEKRNLQLKFAAFNVFNHPLVSFNNANTNNLQLAIQNATAGQALTQSMLQYQNFGVADIKVGNRLMEVQGKFTF